MVLTSCFLQIYCFPASHAPLRLRFSCFDFVMASDRAAHTIAHRSWVSATDRARAMGLPKRHSQVLTWNSLVPLVLWTYARSTSLVANWCPVVLQPYFGLGVLFRFIGNVPRPPELTEADTVSSYRQRQICNFIKCLNSV